MNINFVEDKQACKWQWQGVTSPTASHGGQIGALYVTGIDKFYVAVSKSPFTSTTLNTRYHFRGVGKIWRAGSLIIKI